MLLNTPLEQFQIVPIIQLNVFGFDFSFTNSFLINALSLLGLVIIFYCSSSNKNSLREISFYLAPNAWQKWIESISNAITQVLSDTITQDNEKYLPFILVLFHFILFSNLIGLIPYSFTVTSHLIITFILSFSIFTGINIITFKKYKIKAFSLFLPANTTFFLALLLVPIEFISYIAKPISLGVRLFINLMAGHSLLKVIVSFAWGMILLENIRSTGFIFPLFILIILFGLEFGVALIQAYVFIILTCIYIHDGS